MKAKRIYFLFIMLIIIGIVSEIGRYFSNETAYIIYDLLYYAILVIFGMITISFASKNYNFNKWGYIAGAVLFAASILIMFNMADGSRKDMLFAICSFIPSVQIMTFVNNKIFNCILSWKCVKKSGILDVIGVIILIISAISVYVFHINVYIMLYYAFLYFFGAYTNKENTDSMKPLFIAFGIIAIIYIYLNKAVFSIKNITISNFGYGTYIIVSIYVLWLSVIVFSENIKNSEILRYFEKINFIHIKNKKTELNTIKYWNSVKNQIYSTSILFVLICGVEMFIRFMAMPDVTSEGVLNVLSYFVSGTFFYNLFIFYCIVNLIYAAFGKNLTIIVILNTAIVYLVANAIKLHFHNSVFKLVDFILIREMVLMAKSYIGIVGIVFLVLIGIFILSAVLVNIKRIIKFLKPSPRAGYAAVVTVLTLFFVLSGNSVFFSSEVKNENSDQTTKYINEGIFLYNYDNFKESWKTLFPEKPEDYTKENISEIKNIADKYKPVVSDTKPDVIVILVESYFDINQAKEFTLSCDALPVYRKYGKGNIVSPYFGGESAAVEFEMMTGLSNYYMLEGVIPYTIYFNKDSRFPSIVGEFKDNGYETNVIQPVQPSFYNSANAYKSMGVDNFYSKDILDKYISSNMEYIPDDFIGNKIIDIASDNSKPKFILGVTMEEHSPYSNKYNKEDMEVSVNINSKKLSSSDKEEIEQYSQSIINGGKMIQNVIDYIDNTDRPTLLYVFGDHLPPLAALRETEIYKNKWTKYQTPLIAYSNYKDIDFGENNIKITPNQLAPQILRDAEIEHSSYFDYIFSLRDKYPVIHKEFLSNWDRDELRDYYLLQYDLIFGNKYLLE